jgi:hypothetical protein
MKQPNGRDLFELLVSLYADQEGVTITYDVIERKKDINEERKI